MSPKIFKWLVQGARKKRRIIFTAIGGPDGGRYVVEVRQGLFTVVRKEITRHSAERYVGTIMRKTLESSVEELEELLNNEEDEDDT